MTMQLYKSRKGMNTILALVITLVVALMVVVSVIALLNSNTGNLETFATQGSNVTFW